MQHRYVFKILTKPLFLAALIIIGVSSATAGNTPVQLENHLLGIGICPPWKPQSPDVCARGVNGVVSGLVGRLGIAEANRHELINADATMAGLKAKFATLARTLDRKDRLIIYANLHAGALDTTRPAGPDNDVFVLWTEQKPQVIAFAVAEGAWIKAADFAALVHALPVGEVVFMLNACDSGAVDPLFIHQHPANDPGRPEAVVTSAKAGQFANFSADQKEALFSKTFAEVLSVYEGTMTGAVTEATQLTEKAALPICASQSQTISKLGLDPSSCNQQPTVHDPEGLLNNLELN